MIKTIIVGDTSEELSVFAKSQNKDAVLWSKKNSNLETTYVSLGDVGISNFLKILLDADQIIYHNKYVSRIIEGCNALSVIILFIAFIIAFSGKLKNTIVFILLGSILIHVLNVGRIALLSIALYHFPQYQHLLHGVVFPLIIYGVVFLLWVIWVNKFSYHATVFTKK
jgi:exosortase/archaeosortase family protein